MKISFYDPDDKKPRKKAGKSSFTLDWVSELGWKKNPFQLDGRIAGFEDEEHEVNLFFIKQRRFGTIQAHTGMGKTTLLEWLASELDSRKGFNVLLLNASSAPDITLEVADEFRGMFGKGKEISAHDAVQLVAKKTRNEQFVLLIDDADELEGIQLSFIESLLETHNTQVIIAGNRLAKTLPAEDQLSLSLGKRTADQNERILADRIEAVGGSGMHPFTQDVVQRMTDETDNTEDFLQLAHETAIHIALNHLNGTADDEEIAKKSEKQATRKKTSSGVQGREKTKYDDLIESLGEELTK